MTNVLVPTTLRHLTSGRDEVKASGRSVAEVIADLERQYPGMKARLCDPNGHVHGFINIFYEDDDIRSLHGLETVVEESAEIIIVPAIAGG